MRLPPLLLAALFLLNPVMARAQDIVCPRPSQDPEYNKNEARSYYNMGNTFFNMKQYEKSAASFVCVLNLVPYSIMARYRLAKSYDFLGRYGAAREQYRWILADASDEAAVLKPEVEKRLAELGDQPDRTTGTPAAGDPPKDGTPPKHGTPPAGDPPKDGTPPAGDPPKDGTPPKPVTSPAPPAGGLTARWWFWTGVGAVAVFTGAALFSGARTLTYRDRWESDWRPADRDALEDWRLATDLSIGAAVVSAAALGLAIWLDRPGPATTTPAGNTAARWFVLPSCGPAGCGLSLSWEF